MDDEAALLAAIRADPHDDTLRLAYADWLDEQPALKDCPNCQGYGVIPSVPTIGRDCQFCIKGRVSSGRAERAHSIRRGIKKPKRFIFGPGMMAVLEYLPEDRPHGAKPFIGVYLDEGIPCISWITRRGFVDGVQCDWTVWLENEAKILAKHPICFVVVNDVPTTVDEYGRAKIPGRKLEFFRTPTEMAMTPFNGIWAMILRMFKYYWPHITFEFPNNDATARNPANDDDERVEMLRSRRPSRHRYR